MEFFGITLDAPYSHEGAEVKVKYPCLFYYVWKPKTALLTVQVERAGWRQGTISIGKDKYTFVLIDDDCDGNYTTGDNWALKPAGGDMGDLLGQGATRSMLFPSWSKDEKMTVEVRSVDHGRTPRHAARQARRRRPRPPTSSASRPRARPRKSARLKLDPMRPKADPGRHRQVARQAEGPCEGGVAGRATART